MIQLFRRLEAPYGNFAGNGNHQFYRGPEIPAEFFRQAGFDLRLSGPTHGGRILVFNFIVAPAYPVMNGYHEKENQ